MRSKSAGPHAFATSVVLHALGLATGAWLLSQSLEGSDAKERAALPPVEVTLADSKVVLPGMSAAGLGLEPDFRAKPEPEAVLAGGGEHISRPDRERSGRAGTIDVAAAALNLADSDDGLTLNRDPLNRLEQSQVQRLATNAVRRSLDDRRATPNPMELAFLATGKGSLQERREAARYMPGNGARSGAEPVSRGSVLGGPEHDELGTGSEPEPGGAVAGARSERTPAGVALARRADDYRRSAAVMLARPWVPKARAAVPAESRGRPDDTLDSSQAVATAVQSLIHASTAGGRATGSGPGGEQGSGPAGSGGSVGPGSHSLASGDGSGMARGGQDPGLSDYFAGIGRRVRPFWKDAFPLWAISEGRSGLAVVGMTLLKDGSVIKVRLVRGSGLGDFDRNVIAAVERAAPYGPLPARYGKGPLTVNITFDALNPAVGRDGPGRGRVARDY